ncbi:MAG: dTMP kinase [Kiritimatiellae bacterium]|nr:dTMP kinase [Kiritimatiellia bacterium]
MPGHLISFEGPEGGGKSTQARLLAEALRAGGAEVLETREPGGTPTGEIIRNLLQNDLSGEPLCDETEALLFCASRAQLCRNVLAPALARGQWVVLDRFTDSTIAYQGYGRGFPPDTLRALNAFATGPVRPSLTFLLDLPVEEGLRRALVRSGSRDRIESAPLDFHRRLRDGYLEMAAREPERFAVLDASADASAVAALVRETVAARLGFRFS